MIATTHNLTGLLRWKNGTLQQQWSVTTYDCGVIFKQYLEWRDVPSWVLGDEP